MADKSLEDFTPDQIENMASVYKAILSNPETREIGLRATKKVRPNVPIPEIDLKDRQAQSDKLLQDRADALDAQLRERDARDRIRDERQQLRDQGFSSGDVAAIEKVMTDERIPSYETAARYYKGQRQIAEPTPHNMGPATTFNLPQDPLAALKGGKQGLSKWAREQATAGLDAIRSGQIKIH